MSPPKKMSLTEINNQILQLQQAAQEEVINMKVELADLVLACFDKNPAQNPYEVDPVRHLITALFAEKSVSPAAKRKVKPFVFDAPAGSFYPGDPNDTHVARPVQVGSSRFDLGTVSDKPADEE